MVRRGLRRLARRTQRSLERLLVRLTADPEPGIIRGAATAGVSRARLALLLGIEGMRGRVELWEGPAKPGGETLRAAFIGDERAFQLRSPEYLCYQLFQPGEAQVTGLMESVPMLRADSAAQQIAGQVDLVMIERSRLLHWRPPVETGPSFFTPTWVRMGITFPPGMPWERMLVGMHAHKNNLRRIQKQGFRFWTSTSEDDFHTFYDRMYIPMITGRHGDYTELEPKPSMLEDFRRGGLLLFAAPPGEGMVAGKLIYHRGEQAYIIASGTLDGDPRWHDLGALSALTYAEIRWAWENSVRILDCGSVRPFAVDGNYLYKLRWGMKPIPDTWAARAWTFWAPGSHPAALRWMEQHPLIQGEPAPRAAPGPSPLPVPVTGKIEKKHKERKKT